MSKIRHFFGWLFATDAYMATLSDDEIGRRALGKKGWRQFQAQHELNDRRIKASLARLRKIYGDPVGGKVYTVNTSGPENE